MSNLGTRSTDSLYHVCEDAIDSICKTWNTTREDVLAQFHKNLDPNKESDRWGMAFTDFATVFFYAVGIQLYPKFVAHAAFKGKSDYLDRVNIRARVFFNGVGCRYANFEYLVDFFGALEDQKLAPLLTMESESALLTGLDQPVDPVDKGPYHDFEKLLSVSSPRRIYIGKVNDAQQKAFFAQLTSRLTAAYQSQVVQRGDEIVVLIFVQKKNDQYELAMAEFDASTRMVTRAAGVAAAVSP